MNKISRTGLGIIEMRPLEAFNSYANMALYNGRVCDSFFEPCSKSIPYSKARVSAVCVPLLLFDISSTCAVPVMISVT